MSKDTTEPRQHLRTEFNIALPKYKYDELVQLAKDHKMDFDVMASNCLWRGINQIQEDDEYRMSAADLTISGVGDE